MISAAELKAAVNPVDVIGGYMPLRKSGRQFVGKCPFHADSTPSFSVNENGLWFCFACAEGGDVLRFIERIESLTFRGAMRKLGAIAGIEIGRQDLPDAGLPVKLAGAELRAFDVWLTLRKRKLQHRWDALQMDRDAVMAFIEEFFTAAEVPAKAVEAAHARLNQIHAAQAVIEETILQLDLDPARFRDVFLPSLYGDPELKRELEAL